MEPDGRDWTSLEVTHLENTIYPEWIKRQPNERDQLVKDVNRFVDVKYHGKGYRHHTYFEICQKILSIWIKEEKSNQHDTSHPYNAWSDEEKTKFWGLVSKHEALGDGPEISKIALFEFKDWSFHSLMLPKRYHNRTVEALIGEYFRDKKDIGDGAMQARLRNVQGNSNQNTGQAAAQRNEESVSSPYFE